MMKRVNWTKHNIRKGLMYRRDRHKEFGAKTLKELNVLLKECEAYSREIGKQHSAALRKIWELLRPWQVQYWSATVLRMFTQTSWSFWYSS